jgi:hypothetical protein
MESSKNALLLTGYLYNFTLYEDLCPLKYIIKNIVIPNNCDTFIVVYKHYYDKIIDNTNTINDGWVNYTDLDSDDFNIDERRFPSNKFDHVKKYITELDIEYIKQIFADNTVNIFFIDDIDNIQNIIDEKCTEYKNFKNNYDLSTPLFNIAQSTQISQFYNIKYGQMCINNYEKNNNFQYNNIIRSRPDVYFNDTICINDYINDTNNVCFLIQRDHDGFISDYFYFGNRETMNILNNEIVEIYSGKYEINEDFIYNDYNVFFLPEVTPLVICNYNNINYNCINKHRTADIYIIKKNNICYKSYILNKKNI